MKWNYRNKNNISYILPLSIPYLTCFIGLCYVIKFTATSIGSTLPIVPAQQIAEMRTMPNPKKSCKKSLLRNQKRIKRRTKDEILVARHNEKKEILKKAIKKQKDFLNHKINKG